MMLQVKIRKLAKTENFRRNIYFKKYLELMYVEFKDEIPWIDSINFEEIDSVIFVEDKEIYGGLIIFDKAPENTEIICKKETLVGKGGIFISCFVVDKKYRRNGIGTKIFTEALKYIFAKNNMVWCVSDKKEIVAYYKKHFCAKSYYLTKKLTMLVFLRTY